MDQLNGALLRACSTCEKRSASILVTGLHQTKKGSSFRYKIPKKLGTSLHICICGYSPKKLNWDTHLIMHAD